MHSPRIKRVAAVHDLSCVGRCSLTVILPVLSCMGVQVCPLPTAVLSTHPGGYSGVAFCDFTRQMEDFSRHWQREGIGFDCVYSGFLASGAQVGIVSRFIDELSSTRPLVLVDPVMGDDGKLYSICTESLISQIRTLVGKADLITPNFTEACFLLGEPWQPCVEAPESLFPWLARLAVLGPPQVVVTGVPLKGGRIANLGHDAAQGSFWQVTDDWVPVRFPGTGDLFASVLLGDLLSGTPLPDAMAAAGHFVATAVKETVAAGTPPREGLVLETVLPHLCGRRSND